MDRNHIAAEMERFISSIEKELGIRRSEIAQQGVYFSHETGTHSSPSSSCAANEVTAWMGGWVNERVVYSSIATTTALIAQHS